MTTITLPPDIEGPLSEAARQQGITMERLALDTLRRLYGPPLVSERTLNGESLYDFLAGHLGTVEGTSEALSEKCGQHFTEGLAKKLAQGRS